MLFLKLLIILCYMWGKDAEQKHLLKVEILIEEMKEGTKKWTETIHTQRDTISFFVFLSDLSSRPSTPRQNDPSWDEKMSKKKSL